MVLDKYHGRSEENASRFDAPIAWRGGAAAGFLATLATSIVILPLEPEMFSQTIAGMYGLDGILVFGLLAHLVNGTVFGIVFAVILADPGLVGITNKLVKTILAGVVYAIGLQIVASAFVLPVWLDFVGVGFAPPIPYVTVTLFIWHLLYGVVLGALFPFLEEW